MRATTQRLPLLPPLLPPLLLVEAKAPVLVLVQVQARVRVRVLVLVATLSRPCVRVRSYGSFTFTNPCFLQRLTQA